MSKESRQRAREHARRPATGSSAERPPGGATGPDRTSIRPTGTGRTGRRERARPVRSASFVDRYRSVLVAAAVIAVIALVGAGLFSVATTPAYACSNEWVPNPTATPGADASPQPGYPQPDMGNEHVSVGTQIAYTYCPPASGRHYSAAGAGPIKARLYGPDDSVAPSGWIHNLEHGGIVILYRGDSEGATEAGQAALRDLFDDYPPSPVCGFEPGTNGPVIARFDQMATPFAALVWGRVLPLETLDSAAIVAFDRAYGEVTSPEKLCQPTPAPTASPSPSAAPSEAASPSPS